MAYIKKTRIHTTKAFVFAAAGIFCAAAIFYTAYLFSWNPISGDSSNSSGAIGNAAECNTVEIIRSKVSMGRGELLDAGKAELVEVPVELAPKGAVTSFSELNSKRLKREISEGEFLNKMDLVPASVSYEEGDRLIEHSFAERAVPAAVTAGSTIDIKLFKKGEEDPVVISKVVVISRDANLLAFYMNSREQEYLKEAATEGMLISVQYIDDSQTASDVTYTPLYDKEKIE